MSERCVCCGAVIPEGRQVCDACEKKSAGKKTRAEQERELILAGMKAETQTEKDIIHLRMIILSIRPFSRWWRWGYVGSLRRAIKALERESKKYHTNKN